MGKKPIFKRWWFIAISIVFVLGIGGYLSNGGETPTERADREIAKQKEEKEAKAVATVKEEVKDNNEENAKQEEITVENTEEVGSPQYLEFDKITASSTLEASSNNSYEPNNVVDRNNNTAWVEGKKGSGIGEWIKIESNSPVAVSGIEIANGYNKSEKIYNVNNRVKKIKIEFSNGASIEKELSDKFGYNNLIELDKPIETEYIKFTILDVYKGSKYDDTCISGISAFVNVKVNKSSEEIATKVERKNKISPLDVKWNTKELYANKNSNIEKAAKVLNKMTQEDFDEAQMLQVGATEVFKAPWKYYGQFVKFNGTVAMIQMYPPGGDISKLIANGGECAEIVLLDETETTGINYFFIGALNGTSEGEAITVIGLPVGQIEVQNSLGGVTTNLVIVGK